MLAQSGGAHPVDMGDVMRNATVGYILQAIPVLTYEQVRDAEIGVLNASIAYAKEHGMAACWNNPHFARINRHILDQIGC